MHAPRVEAVWTQSVAVKMVPRSRVDSCIQKAAASRADRFHYACPWHGRGQGFDSPQLHGVMSQDIPDRSAPALVHRPYPGHRDGLKRHREGTPFRRMVKITAAAGLIPPGGESPLPAF